MEGDDMARMTSMDALETKIEKAQEQVSRTKKQYDAALARLSDLLDKRDALRRDELVKSILKSDKTYEEVLEFLGSGQEEAE
jgi:energy-converting hydrogenase A subunit M